jgi:tRNA 5-methylaminomethyl-2-thiouridine biosynthesis bifunctional protein
MPSGTEAAALPPFPVNGHGNLAPAVPTSTGPIWALGSTFERGATRPDTSAADHAANRQRLTELLPPAAAVLTPQWDDGRAQAWAGVRCTVPDRLPMVGSLPCVAPSPSGAEGCGSKPACAGLDVPEEQAPLALAPRLGWEPTAVTSNAAASLHPCPPPKGEGAIPPLLLTGLGSRGLTVAVLAGEIAAAELAGEPLPVERSLAHALRASRWGRRGARRAHPPKHVTPP